MCNVLVCVFDKTEKAYQKIFVNINVTITNNAERDPSLYDKTLRKQ